MSDYFCRAWHGIPIEERGRVGRLMLDLRTRNPKPLTCIEENRHGELGFIYSSITKHISSQKNSDSIFRRHFDMTTLDIRPCDFSPTRSAPSTRHSNTENNKKTSALTLEAHHSDISRSSTFAIPFFPKPRPPPQPRSVAVVPFCHRRHRVS